MALFENDTDDIPRDAVDRLIGIFLELLRDDAGDEHVEQGDAETPEDAAVVRAMNSIRGRTLEAAAQFVLWARRVYPERGADVERTILDRTAALLADPSDALAASFGHAFGWWLQIDAGWVERHVGQILPDPTANAERHAATFAGILGHWSASARLLSLLRASYEAAVTRLGTDATFARSHTADRLAQHLATLFTFGILPLDDPLLLQFFAAAPGTLRGRFQWMIASYVDAIGDTIEPDVQRRVEALWDRRLADGATQDGSADELSWFSYFYEAHRGDPAWATRGLMRVIEARVDVNDHRVLEKLAQFAHEDPVLAFTAYEGLVATERRQRFLSYGERGRDIVRLALRSPAADAARALVNALASDGIFTFRDLLEEEGEEGGDRP